MSKRERPIWNEPINEDSFSTLKVFNSLTNQKDIFKPRKGNKIEWYSCGPTVYDVSHMGHARTYISIDILRRIMRDYFKFDVHYVMNITDVDDKIIKRARQNYLYEQYISKATNQQEAIKSDISNVLNYYQEKIAKENDQDMKIMLEREKEGVNRLFNVTSIEKSDIDGIKDAMSAWLDKQHGDTVSDNSIFEDLPKKFEQLFMTDMRELNILPPDELTRVSEYIPKIVEFVVKIIERGLAYESNGSVYFNTEKFNNHDDHYYAKLVPTAYGNESLLQEGEGVLSNVEVGEKHSNNDFALWKASKRGEPSWDSPWGKGRPGWHIECSAMAGDKCGSHLDIHTGGVDLKFPHHDNEIAQSEAYFGCKQWVNYFLHTGHLTISGCKMSKSLKNFISIKDALSRHSSRQLRLAFLLSSWKDTLDYSDDLMTSAIGFEKMLLDFFFTTGHIVNLGRRSTDNTFAKSNLHESLMDAKKNFHDAICDSFDTRACMNVLKKLVEETNKHCISQKVSSVDIAGVTAIAEYVYEQMRMFGAAEDGNSIDLVQYNEEYFRETVSNVLELSRRFNDNLLSLSGDDDTKTKMIESLYVELCDNLRERCHLSLDEKELSVDTTFTRAEVEEILRVIGQWRQAVRSFSRANKFGKFLGACDDLRDKGLRNIGVRLQDTEDDHPAVGLYPSWAFEDKAAKVKSTPAVSISKVKIDASVDPRIMFTVAPYVGQFSAYDDEGLPTHGPNGDELSKNRRSKLKKLQADQAKKYQPL